MPGQPNKTIHIIAEGMTEAAASAHLKAFLDGRSAGKARVRLRVIRQGGGLKESAVRGLAETALKDDSTVGVVALTDVFPEFNSAVNAQTMVASWMPPDGRCRAHVACHDFEAWLLVGWSALLKQAGVAAQQPWGNHPENINTGKPPAHRIHALFQLGKPKPRKYSKVIDGKKLFEKLDLVQVAAVCPEFKAFLNCLLEFAGYDLLA